MAERSKRRKMSPSDARPAAKEGNSAGAEPIAIVGIGCRFPGGAHSPETFWSVVRDGVDAIAPIPADRPDLSALYDSTPGAPGKIVTREGGFLADLDRFDPYSFGISPREATFIDPQQRLLLEVAWEAFEDAGIVPTKAFGNVGVFIGMWTNDYEDHMCAATRDIDLYITTGGGRYSASGRLSYIFDLRGPSMTIDTACSSSLVAVDLACESLRKGETELALAGGVNLILQPYISIGYSKSKMLSPDSRCKFGDAHANGYVRSEGAGIILLKPLSHALADRDPVYAVILGSAVNNDGQEGLFVAPSRQGQESVLRQAYRAAGIPPSRVHYIEAHGTGTAVGDPVEIQALGTVLAEGRRKDRPFSVGSIKTNIGHTEAASGIAGLIKAALCLKHRIIPPSLHLKVLSPNIPWHELPLSISRELHALPADSDLAVAGVNSFGVTGTNAHVVLQESPPPFERNRDNAEGALHSTFLLPLSAPRPEALQTNARAWGAFLAGEDENRQLLHDVCYTAAVRRGHHGHRLTVIGKSRDEIVERLEAAGRGEFLPGVARGRGERDDKLVFVFSGQGPQWFAMGRELLEREPVYRRVIEECDRLLRAPAKWSLLKELTADESRSRLDQTEIAQPAIFALQIGVAALWRSWGIVPDAVVGHSVGEVAAAHVAGVLDLEQAIRLIFHRGRLLQSATGRGKMAAAELTPEEAERLLADYQDRLSIAAINSPSSVVISGESEALQEIFNLLEQRRKFCRFLQVNYAFHSPQVEPYRTELVRALGGLKPARARIPILSTVTGKAAAGDDLDPEYWGRNVRRRVEFASAMDELIQAGHNVFVEIGPHAVLGVSISECLRHRGADGNVLASLRRGSDERQMMLEALAALYAGGRSVDWAGLYPDGGRCVRLPPYSWQRERFWLDKSGPQSTQATAPDNCENRVQSFLGRRLSSSVHPGTHFWELTLQKNLLDDHRIQHVVVLPGALTVEVFLAAAVEAFGPGPHVVENVEFKQAMILRDDETSAAQLVLTATLPGSISCQLLSRARGAVDPNGSWNFHAGGVIRLGGGEASPAPARHDPPQSLQPHFAGTIDGAEFYRRMRERGFQYGPGFQCVDTVYLRNDEVLGKFRPPSEARGSTLPADILDACFQLLVALAGQKNGDSESESAFLPVGFDRLEIYGPCGADSVLWAHAIYRADRPAPDGRFAGDVFLLGDDGRVIAEIRGLRLQRLQGELRQDITDWFYEIEWTTAMRRRPSKSPEPDYIPDPGQIAERITSTGREAPSPQLDSLDAVEKMLPRLEALCSAYVGQAFLKMGWDLRPGERVSAWALAERLGVVTRHQRLFGRLLEILSEEGVLQRTDSVWEAVRPLPCDDPQKQWTSLLSQNPDFTAELTLLGDCGQHLAEVLRGERDPLQLLFPQGQLETAEKLYEDAPFSRAGNALIRHAMAVALVDLPSGRGVRVLEIGAGTGGTTAHVLPLLPVDRTEYVFTDVSTLFTTKSENKFRAYPFVRYRLLDISRDPKEQDYKAGQFDIILAANVLHATPDLRQTLRHVKQLLSRRGLLLLLEGTSPQRWIDLIFGLTEGWWLFSDLELRPSHPLLSRDRWLRLLKDAGFAWSAAIRVAGESGGYLFDQAVLIARAADVEEKPDSEGPSATPRPQAPSDDCVLVFADQGSVGGKLSDALRDRGPRSVLVHSGDEYECSSSGRWKINPRRPEDFKRFLQEAFPAEAGPCRTIVYLWALDAPSADEADRIGFDEAQMRICGGALYLVQALAETETKQAPRLWLVTRGAQPIGQAPAPSSIILQAPLWGLGKVIALEHPHLKCSLIDLDPDDAAAGVEPLVEEMLADDAEDQIAFRGGERYGARLARSAPPARATGAKLERPEHRPFQLQISKRGVIDNLILRPGARHHPKPREVEIRVLATGLNFRDVLITLGIYPGDSTILGLECAGTIASVGDGVEEFHVGDEVIAYAHGSFGSFATVPSDFVAHRPKRLSLEEAATIPIVFLTAHYTLRCLAEIKRGDRVLIHAASGGLGMAAVQLAQLAGAEIFATAGSPEKRAFLKSLGVRHVMDSRSLRFADEVIQATEGRGVDIVLNSLAGEFIAKSLSVLAPGGKFLEVGKTGVWTEKQAKEFQPACAYFLFDLIQTADTDPSGIRHTLRALVDEFDRGVLKPLPCHVYPIEDAVSAFRTMSEAKHVGKIVISQNEAKAATSSVRDENLFRPDASYLVTGGFGALGLLTSRWMVEHGARCLALAGRNDPSGEARRAMAELERLGAQVLALRCDVSSKSDVEKLLAETGRTMPPLSGVFHCAGLLEDGVLIRQDWDRFARVMAPKVAGTWNLHALTRDLPLEFFVLFSSWASVLGSPGQGNHAAANAFMDSLAHYRRAQGLPALSVNWGPWSEIGAAAHGDRGRRLASRGIGSFTPTEGLRALQQLIKQDYTQTAVIPFDLNRWRESHSLSGNSAFFEKLRTESDSKPAASKVSEKDADIRRALETAGSGRRRRALLESHIRENVRQVLRLSASGVDSHKAFKSLGLDSLTALELCNRLESGLKLTLSPTLIWNYPNIALLAAHLADMMKISLNDAVEAPADPDSGLEDSEELERLLRDIEQLSDRDARRLLDEGLS